MSLLAHQGQLMVNAATFAEAVLAYSPVWYCRHAETSGTVAVNEVGADGTYVGTFTLGNSPIYPGGLVTWDTLGTSHCDVPGTLLPSPSEQITLGLLLKRKSNTGLQALIDRDPELGLRFWQWRWNGTGIEWIKISGGVDVASASSVADTNDVVLIHIQISAGGLVRILKNGVEIASESQAVADYGSHIGIRIARRVQGDSWGNYLVAESMIFQSAVPLEGIEAMARAAGLLPP